MPPATPLPNETALIDALGLDFAEKRVIEVYRQVSPSVVNITTQVLRRSFFFEVIPEEGAGSGFTLDKEGHIITNFHVIEGAIGGDIITAIDDQPVTSIESLQILLESNYKVGDMVEVTLLREGQEQRMSVELGEEPTR